VLSARRTSQKSVAYWNRPAIAAPIQIASLPAGDRLEKSLRRLVELHDADHFARRAGAHRGIDLEEIAVAGVERLVLGLHALAAVRNHRAGKRGLELVVVGEVAADERRIRGPDHAPLA
jgi:hypothetical protein